jgi:hypothetical protein
MRRFLLAVLALTLIPITAFGFGMGDLGGGSSSFDTSSLDQLLADIKGVADMYTGYHENLKEAADYLTKIGAAHGITDIYASIDSWKDLKNAGKLTKDELEMAQKVLTLTEKLPENIKICVEQATGLIPKIGTAMTDIANEIAKNPMGATKLGKYKDDLSAAQTNMQTIVTEGPPIIEESGKVAEAASTIVL